MTVRFDFAAQRDPDRIELLVEVKSSLGKDEAWARDLRVLLAGRTTALGSTAFLLVTPERFYAWERGAADDAPPTFAGDAEPWLGRYFERVGLPQNRQVDPRIFEEIVGWWLTDISSGVTPPPSDPRLAFLGRALRGARVIEERAA